MKMKRIFVLSMEILIFGPLRALFRHIPSLLAQSHEAILTNFDHLHFCPFFIDEKGPKDQKT